MERIFEKAHEQHLRAEIIYLHESDGYAYKDSKGTEAINKEELVNMFNLGTAVVYDDASKTYFRAVSIKVEDAVATLTYITTTSGVAAATVKSKEAE